MRRTGNRGANYMPPSFKVRCGVNLHTIALNAKGQLVRLDHDPADLPRERKHEEIGGTPCRCTEVIRLLRKAIRDESLIQALPRPLQRPARLAVNHSWGDYDDPTFHSQEWVLKKPLWERPEGLKRLVEKVLGERLGLPGNVSANLTGRSWSHAAYDLTLSSGTSLPYRGWIPYDWKSAIYDHQLAALGGCLTLALRHPDCDVYLLKPQDQAVAVLCRPILGPAGSLRFVTRYGKLVTQADGSGYRVAKLWRRPSCRS